MFQKPQENQCFWLPQPAQDRPKIAPSPVKMAQDRPKTAPRRSQDDLEGYFFAFENRLRFRIILGSILAPFWLPKCLPLGTLLALKIDQKNDPKSDCLEGRSKVAPRAPKTLPRRPPDHPGEPQDPRRGLLDPPRMPQEALPDPLGRPKTFSEASGPITFFGKIELEASTNPVRKKSQTTLGNPLGRATSDDIRTQSRLCCYPMLAFAVLCYAWPRRALPCFALTCFALLCPALLRCSLL
jgi:hypothetical protein